MDFGIAPVLIIGGVAVLGGFAYLFLLVGRDLAPVSGLIGPQRWLLVGGLGVGVFAFSAKLVAIALIAHFRPAHPNLARPAFVSTAPSVPIEDMPRLPPLWRALPEVAPSPTDNPTTPERGRWGASCFLRRSSRVMARSPAPPAMIWSGVGRTRAISHAGLAARSGGAMPPASIMPPSRSACSGMAAPARWRSRPRGRCSPRWKWRCRMRIASSSACACCRPMRRCLW